MFDIAGSQKPLFREVILNAVILLPESVIASYPEILIPAVLQSTQEILHCTFYDGCWLFGLLATTLMEQLHSLHRHILGKFFPKSSPGIPRIVAITVLPWLSLVEVVYH